VELNLHSPSTSSWRGAQLNHRDNFTLPLPYLYLYLYLYPEQTWPLNFLPTQWVELIHFRSLRQNATTTQMFRCQVPPSYNVDSSLLLLPSVCGLCFPAVLIFLRGPFENFVDSPYYSDSKLCKCAVKISFSKYLPWQAIHFLQRSTHFSKTCCRPLNTSKFLASELHFRGWKGPEIAWSEICIEFCFRLGKSGSVEPHQNIRHAVQISPYAISRLFQPWKGSSEVRNFEVINGLQHVFEKWVERCRTFIAFQERYFEK
jgi:hypothetical protein